MILYVLIKIIDFFINILPYKIAIKVGEILGISVFSILRYRRKVVLSNLHLVFKDKKSKDELKEIAKDIYKNLGRSFIETLRVSNMSKQEILDIVEFVGDEKIKDCLSKKNGLIGLSMHYGNWELLGAALCAKGFPLYVIMKRLHNKYLDKWIIDKRKKTGVELIYHDENLSPNVLKLLKNNNFISFLNDQYAGDDGVLVDFLGVPSSFFKGSAVFAIRSKIDMIICTIVRQKDNIHHKVYVDLLEPAKESENAEELTQRFVNYYTKYVFENPEQYFWIHKRWKNLI